MPVLEIVFMPCKSELSREEIETIAEEGQAIAVKAPGLLATYHGFSTTHPNLLGVYTIWDKIQSHHALLHSSDYPQFLQTIIPMLAGPPEVAHLEIKEPSDSLKIALESPVIHTAIRHIAKDKAAAYLNWSKTAGAKLASSFESKHRAIWSSYAWETPFTFYNIGGWDNEHDHLELTESAQFKAFKEGLSQFLDPASNELLIYHFELKKGYGEW